MRTTNARPSRTAVSSSWTFISKPPSPVTVTTRRSGRASFAAIAPGSPMPMAAKPLEMMTVFGRRVGQALGHPELVRADVGDDEIVGLQRRLQIRDDPLRQHREGIVVASTIVGRPDGRNPLRVGRHQRRQQLQRLAHVGDDLDHRLVARVDLGRGEVDVHDAEPARGIPARRRPLDGIVADRDHQVGVREADARRVVGGHADRGARQRVIGRDRALGHERGDDRDPRALGERRQLGRGLAANHAVAGENQRVRPPG